MNSFMRRRNRTEKSAFIIDIGSSSVGAAVTVLRSGSNPLVLHSLRERMTYQENRPAGRVVELILKFLGQVGEDTMRWASARYQFGGFNRHPPRNVFCVFSPPWFVSQTKVLSTEKEKNFTITRDFLRKILSESVSASTMAVSHKSGTSRPAVATIESKIIQMKLNGYETADPFYKEANTADIAIFKSFVLKTFFDQIDRVLKKIFYFKNVTFHSFGDMYYNVVKNEYGSEEDFILVNIGGEVTDVAVSKKGLIVKSMTLPIGKNYILGKILNQMTISPALASSLIKIHAEGKIINQLTEKIGGIVEYAHKEWLKLFADALIHFGEELFLPRRIFLTVNNDFALYFQKAIQSGDVGQFTITKEPFEIILLNSDKIASRCDFGERVVRDSFLAIESIALNILFNSELRHAKA